MIYGDVITIENITKNHLSLYNLIFNRFMASQCKEMELEIKGYRIKFNSKIIDDERIVNVKGRAFELVKSVKIKSELPLGNIKVKVEIVKKPISYPLTQAEVIGKMKEKRIGRPSTYSTIIEKLFLRKYIMERKFFLIPTETGKRVWEFLIKYFSNFVSEMRTKILLEKMDRIEKGEESFEETLKELYIETKKVLNKKLF